MKFDQKQFLKDLETFIGFKTIVNQNPNEFKKARKWIKNFFDKKKTGIEELEFNGYTSLLIKPKGSKKPNLLGDGHIEVVPAEDEFFKLEEQGDCIHGRGVGDMKTQCLMMMYVLRQLIKENNHNNFWILFSEDEEAGSECGTGYAIAYLKEKKLLPKVVFAPDGGSNFSYVEKEKGTMAFTAIMEGTGAHASRPFLAENPINNMQKFYAALQKRFPNPKKESDWIPSCSMTTTKAGSAFNKIPRVCEAQFDLRFTEKYTATQIEKIVQNVAKKHNAKILFHFKDPATYYPKSSPIAKKYFKIIKKITGKKPTIMHSTGASNGRIYVANKPNIHVLLTNPDVGLVHASCEYIVKSSIQKYYTLVYETAKIKW